MKRYFAALLLLIIPAMVTSCWKTGEDWSLCGVDDNFTLVFRLEEGSGETFADKIGTVDVILFDSSKQLYDYKRLNRSALDIFNGVTFTVDPGTYYVVCWANISDNSRLSELDENSNFENSFVEIVSAATGCPIYYAPYKTPVARAVTRADIDYTIYEVNVLPQKETVKELRFAKVHRTVQVYVKGFENLKDYDGENPFVERINISGKYDFLLRADLTPRNLKMRSYPVTVNNEDMLLAQFYTALVPVTDNMDINIRYGTDDRISTTVNLKQYITSNNITDDSVVPILVTYDEIDASVSVSLPSWAHNSVDPEI